MVEDNEEYQKYWFSISNHYKNIKVDKGTKDIARACYLSVDKNPYLNLDSEVYTDKENILKPIAEEQMKSGKTLSSKDEKVHVRENNLIDNLKSAISMEMILREFGVDTTMNPTNCPFHICSQRCLSFNSETCNCFDTDCGRGYNIFSFVKKIKNIESAEAIEWLCKFAGMEKEFEESKRNYKYRNQEPKGWARSISIKKMAERYGLLECPTCNNPFEFVDNLGWWKCNSCKTYGGLKKFSLLIAQNKLEVIGR
jgi:hypothetical protein